MYDSRLSRHTNAELLTSTIVAPETRSSFLHVLQIYASKHIHLATITGEYSTNVICLKL